MKMEITRRTFIQKSSLVIAAAAFSGELTLMNASSVQADTAGTFKPHAFVEIAGDDRITVWLGQTNLGQGTHTGISMIIAEELDADWNNVQAKMALAAEPFKNPHWHMQVTGGSTSIRHRWDMIRKAGAAARQMLVQAAADQWKTDASRCTTESGKVIHPDGRSLSYGKLVADAGKLPVPKDPPLKEAKDYKIIGSERKRLDIPDKVMGKTRFGIDFSIDGMCIATVARPPRYGATVESFDEKAAMSVRGVLKVVSLKDNIAVCGETTHAALKGREKLAIKWSPGTHPNLDNAAIDEMFRKGLESKGSIAENSGNAQREMENAAKTLESHYSFPYISHAQLEPINCTAHVENDRCRIWVPTQGQTAAQMTAAAITGLPQEKVEVMTTPAGGGFGLRGEVAPVVDAVTLSKIMGRPVKVMWTREDDFANDYFRPGCMSKISGGLDKEGKLVAWSQKVATPSIMTRIMPDYVKEGIDPTAIQGIPDMPYNLPNRFVEYVPMDLPIPVGFWRSVGYSFTTFTVETFIDELAHAAGKDPVQFRLDLLEKRSRTHRTLSLLAEKANWRGPVATGRSRGVALGAFFGSSAAHMAEVSVDSTNGNITVHKIICTLDCGPAVYPDAITAQMEGAAMMALSVAFNEKIHFANGGVNTLNYDDYPILTMSAVPEVEVHIVKSNDTIGGVGEPGVPTVAPAVANAVFKATGVMLKDLPFNTEQLVKA